jgi:hypothetical protein
MIIFFETGSLDSPGWLETHVPLASATQVLGLQACKTMASLMLTLKVILDYSFPLTFHI